MKSNNKINVFIIVLSFCLILSVIIGYCVIVDKYMYDHTIENPNPPSNNGGDDGGDDDTDTRTVREFYIVSGLNAEYYLGEPLNVTNIVVHIKTVIEGVENIQNKNITMDYISGDTPTTSTIGAHTFSIIYLDGSINASYQVVQMNAKHLLSYLQNRIVSNNNSIFNSFDLKETDISNLGATTYYETIKTKLVGNASIVSSDGLLHYTASEFGVMNYLYLCNLAITQYDLTGNLTNFTNPDSAILPSVAQNSGNYTGNIWVQINDTKMFLSFTINFDSTTNGIDVVISNGGTQLVEVQANFNNQKMNMAVDYGDSYYINDDLLKTYIHYDADAVIDIYGDSYDANFLTTADYLMLDTIQNDVLYISK